MILYILERKDKEGFIETIQAWAPCKGWRTVAKFQMAVDEQGHTYKVDRL